MEISFPGWAQGALPRSVKAVLARFWENVLLWRGTSWRRRIGGGGGRGRKENIPI
jgi:hypothetical protein